MSIWLLMETLIEFLKRPGIDVNTEVVLSVLKDRIPDNAGNPFTMLKIKGVGERHDADRGLLLELCAHDLRDHEEPEPEDDAVRPPYWHNPSYMIPDESELSVPGIDYTTKCEIEDNEQRRNRE